MRVGRVTCYMPPSKALTEKKFIVERAKVECCEASLIVKKQARHGEENPAEKAKKRIDVCKVRYRENKHDRLPSDYERASAEF